MNRVTGKIQYPLMAGLVMLVVIMLATQSQAIIIRHDKSVRDYRARESRFPAVFYLERQDIGKICVATLIDPQWAITAAHCGSVTSLSDTLQAGSSFAVSVSGQERLIDLMMVHPNYTPDTSEEVDLALIRFSEPLKTPRPVKLNARQEELGKVVSLLGWGFSGMGTTGRRTSDGTLRLAQNRIETAGQRLTIQFGDPRQSDDHVLEMEGMPSLGDSGGPALLQKDDEWVLAGIAVGEVMDENFDDETQGKYGSVAVYERISRHLDWITSTMKDNQR